MRKFKIIMILVLFIIKVTLATEFITLYETQVGPASVHKHIQAPSKPWDIHVLKVDLTNPYISLQTVKAEDQLIGSERTSSMASRNSQEGHRVVGAVNGDFYGSGGVPINSQIVKGQLVRTIDNNIRSTIGVSNLMEPFLEVTNFSGTVIKSNGSSNPISGVNTDRLTNQLILYNSYMGENTGTNKWGTELLISPLEDWIVNDTISCTVDSIENLVGSMNSGEEQKVVLSGHGTSSDFLLNDISVGDTLKLVLNMKPGPKKMTQLMGGYPKIVHNGANYAQEGYNNEGGPSHAFDRHPRTAVGFSADSSYFYFITVDGRQPSSIGMTLPELANFMIKIGVAEGLNLDGGGSTTMVIRNAVKNSPSDGSERFVANSLLAVSSAPDGELNSIQVEPDNYCLFRGEKVKIKANGWDQYFNPVDLVKSNLTYHLSKSLGNIDTNGVFSAHALGDSGYIYANYEGMKDSCFVYLKDIERLNISPNNCMTDTTNPVKFETIVYDENGNRHKISANDMEWKVLDESIGEIDTIGTFRAFQEGETEIVVNYEGFTDTAYVSVEVFEGQKLMENMDSKSGWELSGENILLDQSNLSIISQPKTEGNGAFQVDYAFIREGSVRSWIFLKTNILVGGIPKNFNLDFYSDGAEHLCYILVEDNAGKENKIVNPGFITDTTGYTTLSMDISNFDFTYPIRVKAIQIMLGSSAPLDSLNSGTIYLDNFKVNYSGTTIKNSNKFENKEPSFHLFQNYPNPFNNSTKIEFVIPQQSDVKLSIYDLTGKKITELVNKKLSAGRYNYIFKKQGVSSGIYFYKLQTPDFVKVKKMILLK